MSDWTKEELANHTLAINSMFIGNSHDWMEKKIKQLEQRLAEADAKAQRNFEYAQTEMAKAVELENRLAEAEKVIGFYADTRAWDHDENTLDYSIIVESDWEIVKPNKYNKNTGGKRAREYQQKYGVKG
jgi:uncharacterized protein YbcI